MTRVLRHGQGKLSSYRERFGCASRVDKIGKHEGEGRQDKTACHVGRQSAVALRLLVCRLGRSCAGFWIICCFPEGFSCTGRF